MLTILAYGMIAVFMAMISAPMTLFLSNDAFYFGVVPILAEAAKAYGISAEVIARASLLEPPCSSLLARSTGSSIKPLGGS